MIDLFPLAQIFIHFEPTGHSLRHNAELEGSGAEDVHAKYRDAQARGVGGHESDNNGLPVYIQAGSPEEPHWRQTHPGGAARPAQKTFTTGSTSAHRAAMEGQVDALQEEIKKDKAVVNAKDANGWGPIHEVRASVSCLKKDFSSWSTHLLMDNHLTRLTHLLLMFYLFALLRRPLVVDTWKL